VLSYGRIPLEPTVRHTVLTVGNTVGTGRGSYRQGDGNEVTFRHTTRVTLTIVTAHALSSALCFEVWGSRFGVEGCEGFVIWGLEFGVWGLGFRV